MDRERRSGFQTTFLCQGPHAHILMRGGGPSDFFGSEILAKSDFFESMKNARIFLGCGKGLSDLFGYAKKSSDFFG